MYCGKYVEINFSQDNIQYCTVVYSMLLKFKHTWVRSQLLGFESRYPAKYTVLPKTPRMHPMFTDSIYLNLFNFIILTYFNWEKTIVYQLI